MMKYTQVCVLVLLYCISGSLAVTPFEFISEFPTAACDTERYAAALVDAKKDTILIAGSAPGGDLQGCFTKFSDKGSKTFAQVEISGKLADAIEAEINSHLDVVDTNITGIYLSGYTDVTFLKNDQVADAQAMIKIIKDKGFEAMLNVGTVIHGDLLVDTDNNIPDYAMVYFSGRTAFFEPCWENGFDVGPFCQLFPEVSASSALTAMLASPIKTLARVGVSWDPVLEADIPNLIAQSLVQELDYVQVAEHDPTQVASASFKTASLDAFPTDCTSVPCNSGICSDVDFVNNEFQCACGDDFSGDTCQFACNCAVDLVEVTACTPTSDVVCRAKNDCESDVTLCNTGTCTDNDNSLDGVYSCDCGSDFIGDNCEFSCTCTDPQVVSTPCSDSQDAQCRDPDDDCDADPCSNSRPCTDNDGTADGVFECACGDDFKGDTCQFECDCAVGSVEVTACTDTSDVVCNVIDDCENDATLCNSGICTDEDDSLNGVYSCECGSDFSGEHCEFSCTCTDPQVVSTPCSNSQDAQCQDPEDDCDADPCLNSRPCTDNDGTADGVFECACGDDFKGDTCQFECNCAVGSVEVTACTDTSNVVCNVIDDCENDATLCNSGTCTDDDDSLNGVYSCNCGSDFSGDNCEFSCTCTDPQVVSTPCSVSQAAQCTTPSTDADCDVNPCLNNGVCVDSGTPSDGLYECQCGDDHSGANCEYDCTCADTDVLVPCSDTAHVQCQTEKVKPMTLMTSSPTNPENSLTECTDENFLKVIAAHKSGDINDSILIYNPTCNDNSNPLCTDDQMAIIQLCIQAVAAVGAQVFVTLVATTNPETAANAWIGISNISGFYLTSITGVSFFDDSNVDQVVGYVNAYKAAPFSKKVIVNAASIPHQRISDVADYVVVYDSVKANYSPNCNEYGTGPYCYVPQSDAADDAIQHLITSSAQALTHVGYNDDPVLLSEVEAFAGFAESFHIKYLSCAAVNPYEPIDAEYIKSFYEILGETDCTASPCNEGVCIDSDSRPNGDYACDCGTDYMGDNCEFLCGCEDGYRVTQACSSSFNVTCELIVDDCNLSPCLNDAPCEDRDQIQNGQYNCQCPEDLYSGVNCEHDCTCSEGFVSTSPCNLTHPVQCRALVDDCSVSPCLNDATCEDTDQIENSQYSCQCSQDLYSGVNCEHACQCDDGYMATAPCNSTHAVQCQVITNDCQLSPCLNNATCEDADETQNGQYDCQCLEDLYSGATCEHSCVCPVGLVPTAPCNSTHPVQCRTSLRLRPLTFISRTPSGVGSTCTDSNFRAVIDSNGNRKDGIVILNTCSSNNVAGGVPECTESQIETMKICVDELAAAGATIFATLNAATDPTNNTLGFWKDLENIAGFYLTSIEAITYDKFDDVAKVEGYINFFHQQDRKVIVNSAGLPHKNISATSDYVVVFDSGNSRYSSDTCGGYGPGPFCYIPQKNAIADQAIRDLLNSPAIPMVHVGYFDYGVPDDEANRVLPSQINEVIENAQKFNIAHLSATYNNPWEDINVTNLETFFAAIASDDCSSGPCQNGGQCLDFDEAENGEYECQCHENFNGTNCELTCTCTEEGSIRSSECTMSNNVTCERCESNTMPSNDECVACPSDSYCLEGIRTQCNDGSFVSGFSCETCPIRSYCVAGQQLACDEGQTTYSAGESACIDCVDGICDPESGSNLTFIIIGSVVGFVCLLILLGMIVFAYKRHQRNKKKPKLPKNMTAEDFALQSDEEFAKSEQQRIADSGEYTLPLQDERNFVAMGVINQSSQAKLINAKSESQLEATEHSYPNDDENEDADSATNLTNYSTIDAEPYRGEYLVPILTQTTNASVDDANLQNHYADVHTTSNLAAMQTNASLASMGSISDEYAVLTNSASPSPMLPRGGLNGNSNGDDSNYSSIHETQNSVDVDDVLYCQTTIVPRNRKSIGSQPDLA